MAMRTLTIDGTSWTVQPSGYTTQYTADEFGLLFSRTTEHGSELRVTRYSPSAARSRDDAFMALTESRLRALFRASQPTVRSPEGGYRA
jgi:hypothetical protein